MRRIAAGMGAVVLAVLLAVVLAVVPARADLMVPDWADEDSVSELPEEPDADDADDVDDRDEAEDGGLAPAADRTIPLPLVGGIVFAAAGAACLIVRSGKAHAA